MTYREFKRMADSAAPPNLMGYLFAKDVMTQSLRLGLAGAWDHGYAEVMEALTGIDDRCPALMKSFLPVGEHDIGESEDHAEGSHNVVGDAEHFGAQLSLRGFVLDAYFKISATIKMMRLQPQHHFLQHVMAAYRNEYGLRVIDFGPNLLRWYRRIAYTDP